MKEFVLEGRPTLERVTSYVSAKTLATSLPKRWKVPWRALPTVTSTVTKLTRPKALIAIWFWLRSRIIPDAPTQCTL